MVVVGHARSPKLPAAAIVAAGLGMLLTQVIAFRITHVLAPTMHVPEDTLRLALLNSILESILGVVSIALGIALLKRKNWARAALFVCALVWAILLADGTLTASSLFNLRLESYGFLICLGIYYFCAVYLLISRRARPPEKMVEKARGETQ